MRAHRLTLAAVTVVALVTAGCSSSPSSGPTAASGGSTTATPAASPASVAEQSGFVPYFLHDGLLSPGHRRARIGDPLADAMTSLIEGPDAIDRAAGLTSGVSRTVTLNSITVDQDTATVDLGRQFETGDTRPQVAQTVYSLTQFGSVTKIKFLIDGQPNGATGVLPLTRADVSSRVPAVLVESPAPADVVGQGFHCRGVSKARVRIVCRVLAPDGTVSPHWAGSAVPGGDGTKGTFDLTVTPDAAGTGPVTVVVGPDAPPGDPAEVRIAASLG